MTTHRFFVSRSEADGDRFALPASIERQVRTVLRLGDGLDREVQMGPLANERRIAAMEALTAETLASGARLVCGLGMAERQQEIGTAEALASHERGGPVGGHPADPSAARGLRR